MKRTKFWLYSFFMTLLGFGTACDKSGNMPAEYGTPHASLTIKGKVTNPSGEGLSTIRVAVDRADQSVPWAVKDTVWTNQTGEYSTKTFSSLPSLKYSLIFEDTEGAEGSAYLSRTVYVEIARGDYKNGDNNWYLGEAIKTVDVVLEREGE